MFWIDPQGNRHDEKPHRVRLPDFTTRTAEAVTDELLYELGWQKVSDQEPETIGTIETITGQWPETIETFDTITGA